MNNKVYKHIKHTYHLNLLIFLYLYNFQFWSSAWWTRQSLLWQQVPRQYHGTNGRVNIRPLLLVRLQCSSYASLRIVSIWLYFIVRNLLYTHKDILYAQDTYFAATLNPWLQKNSWNPLQNLIPTGCPIVLIFIIFRFIPIKFRFFSNHWIYALMYSCLRAIIAISHSLMIIFYFFFITKTTSE